MASKNATARPDIEAAAIVFFSQSRLEEILPITVWLEWVRRMAEQRPLRVTTPVTANFRHPWNTQLSYNGKFWEFNTKAGMVNDTDPFRFKDPDETHPTRFKAFIDQEEPVQFPISNDVWRQIGTDADPGDSEPVPEFFLLRNVLPPAGLTQTLFGIDVEENLFKDGARLLRACDLVLTQPRPALAASTDETGLQLLVIQPPDNDPQLNLLSKFELSVAGGIPALEQLATLFTDRTFEELHIATFYMLSPPDLHGIQQPPDDSWTPFVQHHVFWNLDFAVDQVLEIVESTRLEFPGVGLVGGVGDAAIAAQIELQNQLNAQADALLNQSRITGVFWTI